MEHFVLLNKTPIKTVQTVTKINSSNALDHVVVFLHQYVDTKFIYRFKKKITIAEFTIV